MVLSLRLSFAFLLGLLVLDSLQQRLPYHYQSKFMPPWAYLDNMSDMGLYSYLLAQRLTRLHYPTSASWLQLNPEGYASSSFGSPIVNPNTEINEPIIVQSPQSEMTEELDVQSRSRLGGIHQQSRPFQQREENINPRFLLNFVTTLGSASSLLNPLMKTIYYFTTTTTTVTSTSTCIAASLFYAGSSTVLCRKRREGLEVWPAIGDSHKKILPSNVQRVVPTAAPTAVFEDFRLTSSMIERGEPNEILPGSADAALRVKRFFFSTTIVTTYVFSTQTTTRTLSNNLAMKDQLSCRPSQFGLC